MGKDRTPSSTPTCEGMSQEEMIRDLWKAHYGEKGVMLRLDRVERQVKWAQWIGKTALGAAIFAAVEWGLGKAFG